MILRPFLICILVAHSPIHAQLPSNYQLEKDWLLENKAFQSSIAPDPTAKTITLSNGLFERTIHTGLGTTVAYRNLMTDQTVIRAVEQEGSLTIDGVEYSIGGVTATS